MMSGFVLRGFSRPGLAALLANQVVLLVCAAQGAMVTPVFTMISVAVWLWWDWTQTSWITSFTPGKAVMTADDRRQIWISSFLLVMPFLWVGTIFSFHKVNGGASSVEWLLNAACLGTIAAAAIASYFKHVRI